VPLLDHFHPPIHPRHAWESFHANWATRITDALMDILPHEFRAEEHIHVGPSVEIDVGTFEQTSQPAVPAMNGPSPALLAAPSWTPPAAVHTIPAVFPDTFEVKVFGLRDGLRLVAAIELVSPSNKDRPEERRAFATKCASYLHQGVSLIIMDIVTSYRSNLHNEALRLMEVNAPVAFPADTGLYAVAYRPVLRGGKPEIELWPATFGLGDPLPTLPLRLTGDLFVPVEFEATYQEACRRRRLA
jgi:hypothetical protein